MPKFQARLLDRPGTEHNVEADHGREAPDEYVIEHCKCRPGFVFFVQCFECEHWVTWKVEVVVGPPVVILMTQTIHENAARRLLGRKVSKQ